MNGLLKRLVGFLIGMSPFPKVVLIQLWSAGLVFSGLAFGMIQISDPWGFALLQSIGSMLLAFLLRSERWWVVIHGLLPVAIAAGLQLHINPNWYLILLGLLLLVFGPSFKSRVPLFLSSAPVAEAVSALIGKQSMRVLDFGSGTGKLLLPLARRFPGHRFEGVEAALIPYLISRILLMRFKNVSIRLGSFWNQSLSGYDVVYAFLSPAPMPELWEKAKREMRKGTLLISNSFEVPGQIASSIIEVDDSRKSRLFVYRI